MDAWSNLPWKDIKDVNKLIRVFLKKGYPSQKFSVRMGHSRSEIIRVEWDGGPPREEIEEKLIPFQYVDYSKRYFGNTDYDPYICEHEGESFCHRGWISCTQWSLEDARERDKVRAQWATRK